MFVQKEQVRRNEAQKNTVNSDYSNKEFVQRKSLTQLIYKEIEDVYTITKRQYDQVLKEYPMLAIIYEALQDFYAMIYSQKPEKFEPLLNRLEHINIPEINTFCNGVRTDIVAVKMQLH